VPGEIEERINQLRVQIEEATSEYDKEKPQERLAKLVGGVAVIKVGAATETELMVAGVGETKTSLASPSECRVHRFIDADHRSLDRLGKGKEKMAPAGAGAWVECTRPLHTRVCRSHTLNAFDAALNCLADSS
jgi:hypothetical protein